MTSSSGGVDGVAPPYRGDAPDEVPVAAQAQCHAPGKPAMEGINYVESAPVPEPALPSQQPTAAELLHEEARDGANVSNDSAASITHEASPQRSLSLEHVVDNISSAIVSRDDPMASSSAMPLSAALSQAGGGNIDLSGAAMTLAGGNPIPHNGHVLAFRDPAFGQPSVLPHHTNGLHAILQQPGEYNGGAEHRQPEPPEGDGGRRTLRRCEL